MSKAVRIAYTAAWSFNALSAIVAFVLGGNMASFGMAIAFPWVAYSYWSDKT